MNKYIFFDLDGTLLPMDLESFTNIYFKGITNAVEFISPKVLYDSIWNGTKYMYANTGDKLNIEEFNKGFKENANVEFNSVESYFEKYYENDFINCKEACNINNNARNIIDILKSKGYKIVIATNPIFPKVATYSRLNWIGLDPNEFELITTYENSHYTKPNPKYYLEICEKLNLKPEECIMVGNDVLEDGISKELGFKFMLITDNLINSKNLAISADFIGNVNDFIKEIENNF